MGTHPIFESDFDCLTESKKMTSSTNVDPSAKFIAANWQRVKNRLSDLSRQTSPVHKTRLTGPVRYCDKRAYYPPFQRYAQIEKRPDLIPSEARAAGTSAASSKQQQ